MRPVDSGVYEFGPFRLDIADRSLRLDGAAVPLELTQFMVLSMLVRDAGKLVTREHLMEAVWKDTHVDEGSLTVTISVLRRKLGDAPSQPRYIATVRKSGYRFVAPVTRAADQDEGPNAAPPTPSAPRWRPAGRRSRARVGLIVASFTVLIAIVTGWFVPRSQTKGDPVSAPVPLHPFGGMQDDPSFSPDGRQVAFAWQPPQSDNHDIYVLKVGDLEATRLTTDRAWDMSPAWSPDGRQIAFIRRDGSVGEIRVISPTGGPEQKIVETLGTSVTWSADSRTLVFIDLGPGDDVQSVFLVSAAGGSKRQVTFPASEHTYGDSWPAVSPDGRTLAFVRRLTYDVDDIFVQSRDGGKPRRLTFDNRQIRGLAWMPTGRELIFSSNRLGRHQLWRLDADGSTQPRPVERITDARFPVVSRASDDSGARLVYQTLVEDYNIRVLHRGTAGARNGSELTTVAASIRDEQSPRVSPDGRRLAFVSDRSGWFEVWVCVYPGGSDCRQLTSFRRGYVGSPSWSPDSQRIAFDARVDGDADIYLVRADGGQPVRLTRDASVDSRPTWSRDGRWIYFRSDRTGAHQIWKMAVNGSVTRQVTVKGGFDALESSDGASLFYVQGRYTRGLWSVPVDGGPEIKMPGFESLTASSWTVIDRGILWIDDTTSNPPAALRLYDFVTRETSTISKIPAYVIPNATGLSAIRDGSIVLWSQLDRSVHDLMLLDRFR
jgi:Tol biopolymer transport system component/DNA-binding winged helix-turn-helix (wHTH) protein